MAASLTACDDALRILKSQGISVSRVIMVDVDSVLYLNSFGQPRTGWLVVDGDRVRVHSETGFNPEPTTARLPIHIARQTAMAARAAQEAA